MIIMHVLHIFIINWCMLLYKSDKIFNYVPMIVYYRDRTW